MGGVHRNIGTELTGSELRHVYSGSAGHTYDSHSKYIVLSLLRARASKLSEIFGYARMKTTSIMARNPWAKCLTYGTRYWDYSEHFRRKKWAKCRSYGHAVQLGMVASYLNI